MDYILYSPGRSRYNKPTATRGPTSYIPNMDHHCPYLEHMMITIVPMQDLEPKLENGAHISDLYLGRSSKSGSITIFF